MHKRSTDGAVYLSIYLGTGKEGQKISDTLKAQARKHDTSVSNFMYQAAMEKIKSDTLPPLIRKPDTFPKFDPQNLPPSLRPAARSPARPQRLRDDEEGIPPPKIDEPAPSSKPLEVELA